MNPFPIRAIVFVLEPVQCSHNFFVALPSSPSRSQAGYKQQARCLRWDCKNSVYITEQNAQLASPQQLRAIMSECIAGAKQQLEGMSKQVAGQDSIDLDQLEDSAACVRASISQVQTAIDAHKIILAAQSPSAAPNHS